MRPIEFAGQTTVYAKDQPEYLPLPALVIDDVTITCWTLTLMERITLLFTGRLWLKQMNFGKALQPQLPTVDRPWEISKYD